MSDLFVEYDGPAVDIMATAPRGLEWLRDHFAEQQKRSGIPFDEPIVLNCPISGFPEQAESVIEAACRAGLLVEVVGED